MFCLIDYWGNVKTLDRIEDIVKDAYECEHQGLAVAITYNGQMVYSTINNNSIIYNGKTISGLYDLNIQSCEIFLRYAMEGGYTLLIKGNKKIILDWCNGF